MKDIVENLEAPTIRNVDYTPFVGKSFETEEEAYDFYNNYAGTVGFSIRRDYVTKSKIDDKIITRKIVCSKEGAKLIDKRYINIKRPHAETRTKCQAFMLINFDREVHKFIVTKWNGEHNHSLHIKECLHMMRSQRKITTNQGINVRMAVDSGISLKSTYELLSTQAGGRELLGFTRKDQENYLRTRRQRDMIYGDAGSLLRYFHNETAKNPSFYHGVQMDSNEQITNIFWADPKMIMDYGYFGDVVSFDTTFRTNKEYQPLGCFVGFNHFRELVIFGVALLYDETAVSFEWLFKTFLHAMSGKKPITIFTDEDQAMAKALSEVMPMPGTFHALCTWHLMQNGLNHLGYLFKEGSNFGHELSACIYKYKSEKELNSEWEKLLTKYDLHDNKWIKAKWEVRKKWALAYLLHTFTTGMRSTQLSESLNSDLRDFLKPDHDIVQLFTHFNRVLKDKRYKEFEAEYGARQKLPRLNLKLPMLKQAASVYTPSIFEKFQKQYTLFFSAIVKEAYELEGEKQYLVGFYEHEYEYVVSYNEDNHLVSCACKKFERIGILCSHAIKVLDVMNIKVIPNHYILKRWRRDARTGFIQNDDTTSQVTSDILNADDLVSLVPSRSCELCPKMVQLASRGSENNDAYQLVSRAINDLSLELDKLEISRHSNSNGKEKSMIDDIEPGIERSINDIPEVVVQAKGLKKRDSYKAWGRRRLKPWQEGIKAKASKRSTTKPTNRPAKKSKATPDLNISTSNFEPPMYPSQPFDTSQFVTSESIEVTQTSSMGANDFFMTEGFFDFLGKSR